MLTVQILFEAFLFSLIAIRGADWILMSGLALFALSTVVVFVPFALGTGCRCVAHNGQRTLLSRELFEPDVSSGSGAQHDYRAMSLVRNKPSETGFRVEGVLEGVKYTVRGTVTMPVRTVGPSMVFVRARLMSQGVYALPSAESDDDDDDDRDDDPSEVVFSGPLGKRFNLRENVKILGTEDSESAISLSFSAKPQKLLDRIFSTRHGQFYRVTRVSYDSVIDKFQIEVAHGKDGPWTPAYTLSLKVEPGVAVAWTEGELGKQRLVWTAPSPFGVYAHVTGQVFTETGSERLRLRYSQVSEQVINSFREGDIMFQSLDGSGNLVLEPATFGCGRIVSLKCSTSMPKTNQPVWRDGHRIVFGFTRRWYEHKTKLVIGFLAALRKEQGRIEVLSGSFIQLSFGGESAGDEAEADAEGLGFRSVSGSSTEASSVDLSASESVPVLSSAKP